MPPKFFRSIVLLLGAICASSITPAQNSGPKPLVVGYFGQWGLYEEPKYTLKNLAGANTAGLLDQLNYAQAFVTGGHCSIADRNADLDYTFNAQNAVDGKADDPASPFRGHLHQLSKLKHAYPRLKTLISLEGQASDFAFDAQPEHRAAFVASCVDLFIKGNLAPGISAPGLFDGIDVDWEYPHGPDAANFVALLTELRQAMDRIRPGLMLSIAVGPSPRMYPGTDFTAASAQVDEVGLMTYDMAGPWMDTTGFIAPLYRVFPRGTPPREASGIAAASSAPSIASIVPSVGATALAGNTAGSTPRSGGVSGSVEAYMSAGVPASKLLIGIPFYGYGWTGVPDAANGLFQEGTPVHDERPYSYIASLLPASTLYRDPVSQAPWLFDGDAFWTFEDPLSIRAKAAFANEHKLGGLMIWELSGDTPGAALLNVAHQELLRREVLAQAPPTTP